MEHFQMLMLFQKGSYKGSLSISYERKVTARRLQWCILLTGWLFSPGWAV